MLFTSLIKKRRNIKKETHKKGPGRPKKSSKELRKNRVNVKYTDDDFLLIKKIQEDHGFSYPADAVHWMTLQISPALENSYDVFQTHVNAERIRDAGMRNGLSNAQIDGMIISLLSINRASDEHIVREMEESQ